MQNLRISPNGQPWLTPIHPFTPRCVPNRRWRIFDQEQWTPPIDVGAGHVVDPTLGDSVAERLGICCAVAGRRLLFMSTS